MKGEKMWLWKRIAGIIGFKPAPPPMTWEQSAAAMDQVLSELEAEIEADERAQRSPQSR